MEDEAIQLEHATVNQSEEVSLRISRLETQMASLSEQLKRAEELEAAARQETEKTNADYTNEMDKHLAHLKELTKARTQISQDRTQLKAMQLSLAKVNQDLTSSRSRWNGQRKLLEEEKAEQSRRCKRLEKEAKLKDKEIENLGNQLKMREGRGKALQERGVVQQQQHAANTKPTVTAQRPAVISSPGQVAAGSGLQLERTTPTASIRLMAIAPRTVNVTPMAAPSLVAITSPSLSATVSPTVVPIRDEVEPVAGPSSAAHTTDAGRSKKRARGAETEEDATDLNVKRSRVQVVEEEEQQHPIAEELETSPDDDASHPIHDVDIPADYEEQQLEEVDAVAAMPEQPQRQQPMVEEVESEAFVPANGAPPVVGAPAAIRPPPREDRLPSYRRNTLAFEDGGDDGVFGSQPDLSLPAGVVSVITASGSTLESEGMEDVRMDLDQLEESSGRNVPEEPLGATGHAVPLDEQSDF